jgi:glycerol-3-phosphate acyltransferase PlsY
VGLAVVVGNRFPCFHQFKGSKGVASYLGLTTVLAPLATALSALVWVIVYGIVRVPFVASFFMVAVLVIGSIMACSELLSAVGSIATALFIGFNHKTNVTAWRKA